MIKLGSYIFFKFFNYLLGVVVELVNNKVNCMMIYLGVL